MRHRRCGLLLWAALASLALHLLGELRAAAWQVYVFKPLTTTLIVLLALCLPPAPPPRYRVAVVAGLVCSLAGDVFLMLPSDRFVEGLASFLVAHVCYLVAFTSGGGPGGTLRRAWPFAAWYAVLLAWLAPLLGPLLLPVAVYGLALGAMAWQAWERASRLPSPAARRAAVGATLFVVSDTLLAINRFVEPVVGERLLVMGTYVAAQALIALSVAES